MNAPHRPQAGTMTLTEQELIEVLQSSLYPGVAPNTIKMIIGYCRAAGFDPMLKPVHAVPMRVKKPGTRDDYEWRDVIMPGIGNYRTQAARTGEYVGKTEPEFGPTIEAVLGGNKTAVPEWCRITVYRLVGGVERAFTAKEYWLENYATAGANTDAPNQMWRKRKFGQLAKCAEAQALRMAFPEQTGGTNTAEEMEGKIIEADEIDQNGQLQPKGSAIATAKTASGALDAFAGRPALTQDVSPVINQTADHAAKETVAAGAGPATTQNASAAQAADEQKPPSEHEDDADGLPMAPAAAITPWNESKKWMPYYKWFMGSLSLWDIRTRQGVFDRDIDVLRAVAAYSPQYRKALVDLLSMNGVQYERSIP